MVTDALFRALGPAPEIVDAPSSIVYHPSVSSVPLLPHAHVTGNQDRIFTGGSLRVAVTENFSYAHRFGFADGQDVVIKVRHFAPPRCAPPPFLRRD